VCFHCQQCAEKYLKGLLEELVLDIPKTHDLERLQEMLELHYPTLRSLVRGLKFLSNFAVTTRYPGEDATQRQAKAALRWMDRIRTMVRTILALPPKSKKSSS